LAIITQEVPAVEVGTDIAAQRIGVARQHINHLCRAYLENGKGLACRKVGEGAHATYYIRESAIEEYLKEREARGTTRGWKAGRARKKADKESSEAEEE
jgi:hypothetical protein